MTSSRSGRDIDPRVRSWSTAATHRYGPDGDADAEAISAGAVFLAAFTTKAAVYALLRGFPGVELLIPVGIAMAAYGLVYARERATCAGCSPTASSTRSA